MSAEHCQSCGMPMQGAEFGTEKDGGKSQDYCSYCYQKGAFTSDTTMEGMIDICVPPMVEANPQVSEAEARKMMQEFFPQLKRWKQ